VNGALWRHRKSISTAFRRYNIPKTNSVTFVHREWIGKNSPVGVNFSFRGGSEEDKNEVKPIKNIILKAKNEKKSDEVGNDCLDDNVETMSEPFNEHDSDGSTAQPNDSETGRDDLDRLRNSMVDGAKILPKKTTDESVDETNELGGGNKEIESHRNVIKNNIEDKTYSEPNSTPDRIKDLLSSWANEDTIFSPNNKDEEESNQLRSLIEDRAQEYIDELEDYFVVFKQKILSHSKKRKKLIFTPPHPKNFLLYIAPKIPAVKHSPVITLRIRSARANVDVGAAAYAIGVVAALVKLYDHTWKKAEMFLKQNDESHLVIPSESFKDVVNDRRFEQLIECVLCGVDVDMRLSGNQIFNITEEDGEIKTKNDATNDSGKSLAELEKFNQTQTEKKCDDKDEMRSENTDNLRILEGITVSDSVKVAWGMTVLKGYELPSLGGTDPKQLLQALSIRSRELLLFRLDSLQIKNAGNAHWLDSYGPETDRKEIHSLEICALVRDVASTMWAFACVEECTSIKYNSLFESLCMILSQYEDDLWNANTSLCTDVSEVEDVIVERLARSEETSCEQLQQKVSLPYNASTTELIVDENLIRLEEQNITEHKHRLLSYLTPKELVNSLWSLARHKSNSSFVDDIKFALSNRVLILSQLDQKTLKNIVAEQKNHGHQKSSLDGDEIEVIDAASLLKNTLEKESFSDDNFTSDDSDDIEVVDAASLLKNTFEKESFSSDEILTSDDSGGRTTWQSPSDRLDFEVTDAANLLSTKNTNRKKAQEICLNKININEDFCHLNKSENTVYFSRAVPSSLGYILFIVPDINMKPELGANSSIFNTIDMSSGIKWEGHYSLQGSESLELGKKGNDRSLLNRFPIVDDFIKLPPSEQMFFQPFGHLAPKTVISYTRNRREMNYMQNSLHFSSQDLCSLSWAMTELRHPFTASFIESILERIELFGIENLRELELNDMANLMWGVAKSIHYLLSSSNSTEVVSFLLRVAYSIDDLSLFFKEEPERIDGLFESFGLSRLLWSLSSISTSLNLHSNNDVLLNEELRILSRSAVHYAGNNCEVFSTEDLACLVSAFVKFHKLQIRESNLQFKTVLSLGNIVSAISTALVRWERKTLHRHHGDKGSEELPESKSAHILIDNVQLPSSNCPLFDIVILSDLIYELSELDCAQEFCYRFLRITTHLLALKHDDLLDYFGPREIVRLCRASVKVAMRQDKYRDISIRNLTRRCLQFFNESTIEKLVPEDLANLFCAFGHLGVRECNAKGDLSAHKKFQLAANIPMLSSKQLQKLTPGLTVKLLYGVVTIYSDTKSQLLKNILVDLQTKNHVMIPNFIHEGWTTLLKLHSLLSLNEEDESIGDSNVSTNNLSFNDNDLKKEAKIKDKSSNEPQLELYNLCNDLLSLAASEIQNNIKKFSMKDIRVILESYEGRSYPSNSLVDAIEKELNDRSSAFFVIEPAACDIYHDAENYLTPDNNLATKEKEKDDQTGGSSKLPVQIERLGLIPKSYGETPQDVYAINAFEIGICRELIAALRQNASSSC